jgi:hypothetical protein
MVASQGDKDFVEEEVASQAVYRFHPDAAASSGPIAIGNLWLTPTEIEKDQASTMSG